jgi:transcriptional regulator with PAS, ATPase and Fis domain
VIAATNRPVFESLDSGAVRKDLYYRLSVITLHIPPLRERREDVPLLIDHFLKKHEKNYSKTITIFEPAAMDALIKYSWPGNVRELENLVEMLLAYGKSPIVRLSDLPERLVQDANQRKPGTLPHTDVLTLKEAERQLIINALTKSKGNKSLAAQMLGISRKSLYKKLDDYGLNSE